MCVFSEHSVTKDPQFSKLDLVSCRNLLIYLDNNSKRRALRTLHRVLNKDGLLFVGHSEAGLPLLPYFRSIRPLKAFVHAKAI
jgi:two-component system CheB/CheR fusion protein